MEGFLIQALLGVDLSVRAKNKDAAIEKVTKWAERMGGKAEMGEFDGHCVVCDGIDCNDADIKIVGKADEEAEPA